MMAQSVLGVEVTPFLRLVDPDGEYHIALGRQAAEYLAGFFPLGAPDAELVSRIETQASNAVRSKLEPLGASPEDLRAAFLIAAAAFGQHYQAITDRPAMGTA